jgi:beta-xylosidase
MLDELLWDEASGWPYFRYGPHPSVQAAVPWPGTIQNRNHDVSDDFDGKSLPVHWQWDFRHCEPLVRFEGGDLLLPGQASEQNPTGTALTVRPTSGTYELTTEVVNHNGAAKGLVLYGDAGQAVGLTCINDKVQTWQVRQDQRAVIGEAVSPGQGSVFLRIAVQHGYLCRFYWSTDNRQWKELKQPGQGTPFYDASYLPPWDRSARPGLIHQGDPAAPARFAWFRLRYE